MDKEQKSYQKAKIVMSKSAELAGNFAIWTIVAGGTGVIIFTLGNAVVGTLHLVPDRQLVSWINPEEALVVSVALLTGLVMAIRTVLATEEKIQLFADDDVLTEAPEQMLAREELYAELREKSNRYAEEILKKIQCKDSVVKSSWAKISKNKKRRQAFLENMSLQRVQGFYTSMLEKGFEQEYIDQCVYAIVGWLAKTKHRNLGLGPFQFIYFERGGSVEHFKSLK